jgi:hypothetical protein
MLGFYGYSSYASSGAGGAIAFKFSRGDISDCTFQLNWVSVGGSEMSLGGAIAGQ